MLKYMRLQLFLTSKKISTYLVPILFALLSIIIIGLPILFLKAPTELLSNSLTNPATLILPFIISTIFVATKALNIFKEPEENGSELLIVSKPITRTKLVLGKFFSLYTLLFLFAVAAFFTGMIIGLMDQHATFGDKFKFAASFAIGTFIIQMLLSSIIIFFSSVLGKVGTMVISILLPLVLVIVSMILVPLSNSGLDLEYRQTQNTLAIRKNGKVEKRNVAVVGDATDEYKKHEKTWYKTAAYFDVWTQLSSFYSIAQSTKSSSETQVYWREDKNFDTSNMISFLRASKGADSERYIISGQQYDQKNPMKLDEITQAIDKIYNQTFVGEMKTKIFDLALLGNNVVDFEDIKYELKDYIYKQTSSMEDSKKIAGDFGTAYMLSKLTKEKAYTSNPTTIAIKVSKETLNNESFFYRKNTSSDKIMQSSPYISKGAIYGIWLFILIGISGLVIVRFIRRDFK